jgi:phosphopantothenoylcysteine decarboxylase/phosphopantothenate--cysteine ligase
MGFALAAALQEAGAEVTLVSGPVHLETPAGVNRINIQTAEEMYRECTRLFPSVDGAILSAAVADFRPAEVSELKIKKTSSSAEEGMTLTLIKNPDILATLGGMKQEEQVLVGFSLETHNETQFAREKLVRKNCDMMVMNSLRHEGAGFKHDTNRVSLMFREGEPVHLPLLTKTETAQRIVTFLKKKFFSA